MIVDPMLATGGSMISAIDECISRGADPTMIRVVCAITCPAALGKLGDKYPGLRIYAAMIDEELNEKVSHSPLPFPPLYHYYYYSNKGLQL